MASWLTQFGLTETEVEIYTALLQRGACTAGVIAKLARQHRRTVYDAVERLLEKGLVGVITKNNRKNYLALNPKTLLEFLEAQQAAVEHLSRLVQQKPEQECIVQLFEGKTGLKQVLEDQITKRKDIIVLNPHPEPEQSLSFYFPKYEKLRSARRIHTTMLTQHPGVFATLPFTSVEKIPFDLGNCATNIYGDTVSFLVWSDPSFSLCIQHPLIAQGFRELAALTLKVRRHG